MHNAIKNLFFINFFILLNASAVDTLNTEYKYKSNYSERNSIGQALNKEALLDCLENRYEKALGMFNYITCHTYESDLEAFSVALWGKLICDACLENWDSLLIDIELLDNLLDSCCSSCYAEKVQLIPSNYPTFFTTSANFFYNKKNFSPHLINNTGFAFPDEVLTKNECVARVRLFDRKIREMITLKFNKLPNIPENCDALVKFWDFIAKLSRRAEDCCYRDNHWTICCGPINQIWRTWNTDGVPDKVPDKTK